MKFSIVIPSYNGEKYIEKCILSALGQQRIADEIIISDDNSTDETLAICEKYKDKLKIYKNIEGPSGFVAGWNNAIDKASGDYIAVLHQDDFLDKLFLYEAENILRNNLDVLHFFTTCYYVDNQGESIGSSYPNTGEIHRYTGLEYVKAYQQGSPHIHRCPGVITHRSIFDKCKYEPAAGHIADDDFFYRVGMYTDVIGIIKPLASYRIHNLSETGKLEDEQLVKRLINDYKYQLKQWKGSSFLDHESFCYFKNMVKKYRKRYLGYGIKQLDFRKIIYALK